MDNDLNEKIKNVLSNPEAMAQISAIASGLGLGQSTAEAPSATGLPSLEALSSFSAGDKNTALLNAVKPFLKAEKQDKIDTLIRALSMAQLVSAMKKGGKL